MRRRAVLVVIAALAVGACQSKSEPLVPTATVPQGTTTTNPYAIPPVIDETYVNRVLAGLDHAYGDLTRIVVGTRSFPPDVLDRLKALYVGEGRLQQRTDIIAFALSQGLPGYLDPVGDRPLSSDQTDFRQALVRVR